MYQGEYGRKFFIYSLIVVLLMGIISSSLSQTVSAEETKTEGNTNLETIKLDPSYQHEPFDGWGTALVWFANVTGGWPDELRDQLADDLFGEEGLHFNIARYNIGGGDSPETEPYMRKGGAVPGYWNRPTDIGTDQVNWWDPSNPDHWNWTADANQQWWLKAAQERGADTFEAFSNSAPYFMTQSGYVSGNWDPWQDNLKTDQYEEFSTYLTTVVDRLQNDLNIEFETLSPVNEPNTGYWRAKGRQEGSNWSPASQQKIINEVKKQLDEKQLNTVVSAMDETNPQKFRQNWEQYTTETRANIDQLNVHTYWPEQQIGVRDLAKASGKRLWMSEVDLSPGGIGQDHEDIRTGLGLSERITSDIQKLESEAWVLWQAIEDEVNMSPEHENGNWGLIQVDFAPDDFSKVTIYKNKKYYAMGNYSKFIRPGFQVINSNSSNTLAAVDKDNKSVVIVYTNKATEEKELNLDLSGFANVGENAKALPYVTSATDNIAEGSAIQVSGKKLTAKVKPQSITTFVVSDVSGVNSKQSVVDPEEEFLLINKHSSKVLDIADNKQNIVQKSVDHEKQNQSWKVQKVTEGYSNKELYQMVHSATGKVLGAANGNAVLQDDQDKPNQNWILSTYGNGEFHFINQENGQVLEIGGQSTAENANATLWLPNTGNNQTWKLVKAGIANIEPTAVTVPKKKIAPVLPGEVTAVYGNGDKVLKEVVWDEIDPKLYDRENVFDVKGTVKGTKIKAVATVNVSKIDHFEPVNIKTIPGKAPILPSEVAVKLANGSKGMVEVQWDEMESSLYDDYGKFTVRGKNPYSPVKAVAQIQVTQDALENLSLKSETKANASFTGRYDSAANIIDGTITSARWTNWDPNAWRPEDWVAVDLGKEETLSKVDIHFYDDFGGTRPAETVFLQYWNGSNWTDLEGTQTNVEARKEVHFSFDPVVTSKIRAVMTAMPNTCIAISEVMVWGEGETDIPRIGDDATLESILINGQPIQGFDPETFSYQVEMNGRIHKDLIIKGVTSDILAKTKMVMPESLPGEAVISVTSEDGRQQKTYKVEFVNEDGTLVGQ